MKIKKELEKKTTTKRSKSIDNKSTDTHKVKEKKEIKQPEVEISEEVHAKEQKCSQRPSRKTKEAAAIYMEILSHKLVNEKKVDDDTVSIDSFPELPNVKKTEQRENELKAKAGVSKNEKTNQIEKNVELITNCTFEKENTAQENKRKVNEEKEIDSKLDSEPKKKQIKSQPIRKNRTKNKCSIPEIEPDKSKVKVKTEKQKIDDKNITEIIDPIQVEIKEEKQSVTNLKVEVNDKIKKEVKTESFKEKDVSKQLSKNSTHVIKIDWSNKDAEEEAGKETIKKIITPNVKSIKSFNEVNVKQQEIEKGGDMEIIIYDKYEADIEDSTKEKLKDSNRKEMHLVTDKEKIPLLNSNQIIDSSDSDECLAKIPKVMKSNKNSKLQNTNQNTEIKPLKTVGDVQDENKFNLNEKVDCKSENKPYSQKGIETKDESKSTLKNQPKVVYDSDDECLANISKAKDFKTKTDLVSKRQTRHKHKHIESNDSEESFHIDVKIPRKKQLTRSRSSRHSVGSSKMKSDKFSNINNETDESTTSKNSSKTNKANIKKKTPIIKNQNKIEANFSESDEEPLSKLTLSKKEEDKSAEELKEDILRKQKAFIESPPPRSKVKKYLRHKETKEKESTTINSDNTEKDGALNIGKPKRECAKRPSNYLPMFSSSDDEEKFFHGFSSKNEKKNESIYSHSSLDFLSKDLGRRFGKGKVNMSNEQIEKWLKDSAMAGDESKKEDDMKFGQEIPTETSLTTNNIIDTEKLKNSLLEAQVTQVANEEATSSEKTLPSQEDTLKSLIYKSPGDRKPIFKKERSSTAPTVGAFSANNESSIYAFEEDIEEVVSTPFRRPARRPSSTATSKSEDELSKTEEQTKFGQFRKPILKTEIIKNEEQKQKIKESDLPTKPIQTQNTSKTNTRNILGKSVKKSSLEQLDDAKYKVPSSPSASSSSSAKLYKRQNKQKVKPTETCNPTKMTDFPCNGPGELVEAPTFYPTEKEFQDPLEYIEKIGVKAEQFGICRIVPPATFKPECKVSDDMRFTSYNQYVHKMLHRWGSNFKELMAIKKYLQTQNINLTQPPWIGGMEIDLPRLYQTVQSLGGLKEVIEKEKWSKVSDIMRIPKSAQDRVTKLDDIYCKYLLPYDTLSPDEREKLLDEVETEWAKRESKTLVKMQKTGIESENDSDSESDNEVEECITKGRNMALNAFYRIARNTMSMWFKNPEPTVQEIEQEFWKHVTLRQNHICVHSGSIDSGSWGYGFAVSKNSPFARHAWNLKVLTNNSGSVLRSLGPVMGVTVPTLHVGMVFSACCWYRDPHSLPWIEYLHTGGNKIWYGIPNSVGELFQKALIKLVPNYCRNQGIWLPSDTVMLPPSLLIESGVSLSRTVQEPGQFVVVFPKAFTSSISTGYVVSESVFFAPPSWLKTAQITFDLLRNSCEPSMFSLDKLYLNIISDQRTNVEVLKQMIPTVKMMSSNEKPKRENVRALGVTNFEILPPPETPNARRKKKSQEGGDYECEICRMNLFISMIVEQQEGAIYCLDHAIEQIKKKVILPENCKLLYTYTEDDLDNLVDKINASIGQKMQKKVFNKFSGMPTLLNKQN